MAIESIFHALLIVLVGYLAHTLLGFVQDLRGLGLARCVFPVAELKWWQKLLRHLTSSVANTEKLDKQTVVIRASLVKRVEGARPKTLRYYTHTPEMLALGDISTALAAHNVTLSSEHFYATDTQAKYLLLLGSGAKTKLSGRMLVAMGENVDWNAKTPGEHTIITLYGRQYKCNETGENVDKDFGLIVRRVKPDGDVCLLLAGIHSFGTYAAARVALDRKFQRFVREKNVDSFAQLVEVDIIDGCEVPRRDIKWEKAKFAPINDLE